MTQPNFTGRWRFSADDSDLQIANPDSVVFTIEHDEPSFRLERTLTFGDRRDTFEIELTIGNAAGSDPVRRGDAILYPSMRWDGDQVVFLTTIARDGDESTNVVRYGLRAGGTILVAEESFRGPELSYDNRWGFKRES